MGHPTPLDARALLSRLILHANEGVPWVDFFSNISQTLLDSTGCDAIEVLLQESTHAYRCLLSRKDGFHFERQQHRGDVRTAQADSAIDAIRRNISPACFDPTDRGSFFAADVQSRPGSRSLAMIPLVVGLDRLGVVQLHSERPGFFDHENIATFEAMADALVSHGYRLVSGGTDNHLMLVDLSVKGVTGVDAQNGLERAGITVNKNGIPFDTKGPQITSGIRIGTPAVTTRGMKEPQMKAIAGMIAETLANLNDEAKIREIRGQVQKLCDQFPLYRERLNREK